MRKRFRLLLSAAVMCVALFGVSFTSFATSPSPSRPSNPPAVEVPDEPVPQSGYLTVEDEETPLARLLDEDVPLASPQTGNGSVNMTVVLAVLAGTGALSLLFAGKKPEVALR